MEVYNEIVAELKRTTPRFQIYNESDQKRELKELGVDSMSVIGLLTMIEAKYGVLAATLIEECGGEFSIDSLVRIIEKHCTYEST